MRNVKLPIVKSIHGTFIDSIGLLRFPKLYPLKKAVRKKIAMVRPNVAAANNRANQRANLAGVTIATSAPITGRKIIHVSVLSNIMLLSSLHKCYKCKYKYCKHSDT